MAGQQRAQQPGAPAGQPAHRGPQRPALLGGEDRLFDAGPGAARRFAAVGS
ncbi:hypothetical protein ACFQ2B_26900 [Streptomyces stramineus]